MNALLMQLVGVLVGVLGRILIQALVKLSEKRVRDACYAIAVPYVKALMNVDMDDKVKQQKAFNDIKAACRKAGVAAGDWLINTTIEAVVGELKSREPAVA